MRKVILLSVLSIFVLSAVNCDKNTPIEEPPEEPEYYDDVGTMWQLTSLPGDETNPSWSPDGTKIAFQSDMSGMYQINTIDINSRDIVVLTSNGGENPIWSPDGTKIAFQSNRHGTYEIYVLNIDSRNVVQLTDNWGDNPCWSSDGSLILYDGYYNYPRRAIYTNSAEGGAPTLITKGFNESYAIEPYWFPEMDEIVFASTSDVQYPDTAQSLYIMRLPDGEPVLFEHAGPSQYYSDPAISPDGIYCAYDYLSEEDPAWGQYYASGMAVLRISDSYRYFANDNREPSKKWSPNSREIAFSDKSHTGRSDIFVYSLSDGKKRRVTDVSIDKNEYACKPAWSPDGLYISYSARAKNWNSNDLWVVELNQR
ncbi:MAG: hypothetical protein GY771_07930 [bacterium]|nr:hypothetical protein [bacterium]